jgi:hypothetical protein
MFKQILIITSGGSQLITQLSTLKSKVKNVNDFEITILYNGVYRKSLDLFFNEVASHFKYKYLGQMNFNISPVKLSNKNIITSFITKEHFNIDKIIEGEFLFLKKFKNSYLIIIPIRVKMFADILLLNYLNPNNILYTVDGVVDELPKRNFSGFKFSYLRNNLKRLPIDGLVFSPKYLKKDANKIGIYNKVDQRGILKELAALPMVKMFKEKYLKSTIVHLIFSQHFSLNEDVSFVNEIEFYNRIITNICKTNDKDLILFKPHPRDTVEKIEAIEKLNIDKFVVVEEFLQAVPVEFFVEDFIKMNTMFITGNSSAPFCFEKNENIIAVNSEELFSESLNFKIKEYAICNKVKIIEV